MQSYQLLKNELTPQIRQQISLRKSANRDSIAYNKVELF